MAAKGKPNTPQRADDKRLLPYIRMPAPLVASCKAIALVYQQEVWVAIERALRDRYPTFFEDDNAS